MRAAQGEISEWGRGSAGPAASPEAAPDGSSSRTARETFLRGPRVLSASPPGQRLWEERPPKQTENVTEIKAREKLVETGEGGLV